LRWLSDISYRGAAALERNRSKNAPPPEVIPTAPQLVGFYAFFGGCVVVGIAGFVAGLIGIGRGGIVIGVTGLVGAAVGIYVLISGTANVRRWRSEAQRHGGGIDH
jgi:hypothetical protein